MNLKPKYLIGGLLGTVVLGVLSSAIWDGIKPLSRFVYEKTLYVSTLGIEKYKDGIYQDIAKGYHESVSLEIFVLINSILLSLIFVTMVTCTLVYLCRDEDHVVTRKVVAFLRWPRTFRKRYFVVFVVFYTVFVLTFFTLNLVKTKYANQAVVYFTQMITIVTPHLSEQEINEFHSNFAQVKNKSDYVSIISSLEDVVQKNNLEKPEFNFIF